MSKLHPFHQHFVDEPIPEGSRTVKGSEDPVPPTEVRIRADSLLNYYSLYGNAVYYSETPENTIYGCTALMAMADLSTDVYGQINPGDIFLFPGASQTPEPDSPYHGSPTLNDKTQFPFESSGGALHQQMVSLLSQETTSFIGFSVNFPCYKPGGIGYNSSTCNIYWFGDREIPTDYNGTNWQALIAGAFTQDNIVSGKYLNLCPVWAVPPLQNEYVGIVNVSGTDYLAIVKYFENDSLLEIRANAGVVQDGMPIQLCCNGINVYVDGSGYLVVGNGEGPTSFVLEIPESEQPTRAIATLAIGSGDTVGVDATSDCRLKMVSQSGTPMTFSLTWKTSTTQTPGADSAERSRSPAAIVVS